MANLTIGFVDCPIMHDKAEVRRDKRRKLYYVGLAGKITPNLTDGQEWLKRHTKFINDNGVPLSPVEKEYIQGFVNEGCTNEKVTLIPVNENKAVNERIKPSKSLMNFLFEE